MNLLKRIYSVLLLPIVVLLAFGQSNGWQNPKIGDIRNLTSTYYPQSIKNVAGAYAYDFHQGIDFGIVVGTGLRACTESMVKVIRFAVI